MFDIDPTGSAPVKTQGAFSYELRLDVGTSSPIIVGLASDMEGKEDIDALYLLLLDYSLRAQAHRETKTMAVAGGRSHAN